MSLSPVCRTWPLMQSSMIETSSYLILNGIKYDLQTLAIKQFMPICENYNLCWNWQPNLGAGEKSQIAYNGYNQGDARETRWASTLTFQPNLFIYPEVKQSIFFPGGDFVPLWNSGSIQFFNNETGDVISTPWCDTNDPYVISFIQINDNYFLVNYWYANLQNWGQTNNLCNLWMYNQSNNSFTNVKGAVNNWSGTRSGQYIGKSSDGMKFYFAAFGSNGDMNFGYYDFSNQSWNQNMSNSDNPSVWGGVGYSVIPSQIIPESLSSSKRMMYYIQPTSGNSLNIVLATVDVDHATVTYENCTLDTTTTPGFSFYVNGWNDNEHHYFYTILHKFQDDYYVTTWQTTYQSNLTKIWTFKVNKDSSGKYLFNKLTFVYQSPIDLPLGSYIALDSTFNRLIIMGQDLMTFNFVNGEWLINYNGFGVPFCALYDSVGRVWIQKQESPQNGIYLFVPTVPTTVNYKFEKDSYKYSGSPINTFVNVDVYNYLGQRIAVTGTLKILSGNATFANNAVTKTVTTSTTSTTTVDFTITGPGVVDMIFDIDISQ